MRTLQIAVPDVEYARLGIQVDVLDFSELEKLMEKNRLCKMQDSCVIGKIIDLLNYEHEMHILEINVKS